MTRDVIKVHRDATVPEMAQLMWTHGISGLPVVDDQGALVGIVTELDLMVRNANLHVPRYLRVLDVMIPLGSGYDVLDSQNHYVSTGLLVVAKPWCQY